MLAANYAHSHMYETYARFLTACLPVRYSVQPQLWKYLM
jgi:hypothetical protein